MVGQVKKWLHLHRIRALLISVSFETYAGYLLYFPTYFTDDQPRALKDFHLQLAGPRSEPSLLTSPPQFIMRRRFSGLRNFSVLVIFIFILCVGGHLPPSRAALLVC